MMNRSLQFLLLIVLVDSVLSATTTKKPATTTKKAATTTKKPATTTKKPVTTTKKPVTTTKKPATTTKAVPLCGKCKPAKVALIAANGAGTVTPTRKVLTNTAAGCNRMHVICTAPAGGTIASMEFNKQFGGGYEAKTVTALLKCNAKQNWIFTKDGVSKAITSVGCMYV